MKRIALALVAFFLGAGVVDAQCSHRFDQTACFTKNVEIASGATLTVNGTFAGCSTLATDALAGATATTMTIGNTVSTAVSIGNSAACDTILIGTNADADTITIGDATDTGVSITDDNWSVTAAGVGTFVSLATDTIAGGSATTLTVGNTISTAVSIGNSAACDSILIGTNTDADTITIGESNDTTVSITDNNWSVTAAGVASFAHQRFVNGTTFTAADPNPSKATLQAANVFLVDTTSNAVDLDFADDAALDAADIGSEWKFIVSAGGTNALTVTAGASGVTTVTAHAATSGTSAEDVGDMIVCTAYATTKIACITYAAD